MFSSLVNGLFGFGSTLLNNAETHNNNVANQQLAQKQLDLAEKEYYSNVDIMNKNFGLQQEAFNYNKQQAELTRQREDNAFQRRVQDYVNSGFSPLAAQGVASSSQAPTLTAPQLDPSGVNQATANRLSAYQNAIANKNQTAQLKLQSQQLKLAQIETVKELAQSVFDIKGKVLQNRRLDYENEWYKENGFRDTTYSTLLSKFINGFGEAFDGDLSDFGKWTGERFKNGWNNLVSGALFGSDSGFDSSGSVPKVLNSKGNQVNSTTFYNTVKDIEKIFQTDNIEKINVKKLRKMADNIGWKGVYYTLPDDATKLNSATYQLLRDSFNKYLEEFNRLSPEFKNDLIDKYIKLWVGY